LNNVWTAHSMFVMEIIDVCFWDVVVSPFPLWRLSCFPWLWILLILHLLLWSYCNPLRRIGLLLSLYLYSAINRLYCGVVFFAVPDVQVLCVFYHGYVSFLWSLRSCAPADVCLFGQALFSGCVFDSCYVRTLLLLSIWGLMLWSCKPWWFVVVWFSSLLSLNIHILSSISCYFIFQSLDASLGLKDLSYIHFARYHCYVIVTPHSNDLPLGLLNASRFQLMRW
jgi:hypothetical protein